MHSTNICILILTTLSTLSCSETFIRAKRPSPFDQDPPILYKTFNATNSKPANDQILFKPAYKIERNPYKVHQKPKAPNPLNQNLKQDLPKEKKQSQGFSHIKSIYNSFKRGDPVDGNEAINTIRYVPATKLETNEKLFFLFNLSLLTRSEDVTKADLFIHRKFIRQRLVFDMHYLLYSTQSTNKQHLADKRRKQTGGASMTIDLGNFRSTRFSRENTWQAFSILESIRSYLSARKLRQFVRNETASVYYTVSEGEQLEVPQGDELVLMMEARWVIN